MNSSMEQALLPPPQHIERLPGDWQPTTTIGIWGSELSEGAPAFDWLQGALAPQAWNLCPAASLDEAQIRVLESTELGPQQYELRIDSTGVSVQAGDSQGAQHALATLCQWIVLCTREQRQIAAVAIKDAPALLERGVLLDVARSKRPQLEVLKDLVDRLARWKINRVQLYMEADFAYSHGGLATADRSPYTALEIKELDRYAAARHVELVPNQQSFGHLHSWLRHPQWNHLAEIPEGVLHPFSTSKEPFTLNPTDPRALQFVAGLYDQLLPCFESSTVNVGLDETFDLGLGASQHECETRGKSRVYLEFLQKVNGLLAERGKRMQYWGDIVLETPALIAELPPEATAMVWGYEADFPFEKQLPYFALGQVPFQVCPGTSSWNSLGGRVSNALGNLRKAGVYAQDTGAQGMLICDWGDRGHLQPWPISFFGWVLGAACAWNPKASALVELDGVRRWLDLWAFEDAAEVMGACLIALGSTSAVLEDNCENGNALFYHLVFADNPFPDPRIGTLDPAQVEEVLVLLAGAVADLGQARCARPDAGLLVNELKFARDGLLFSGELLQQRLRNTRAGDWRELPADSLARIRGRLENLKNAHRELWASRFRPGGLQESLAWLDILKHE